MPITSTASVLRPSAPDTTSGDASTVSTTLPPHHNAIHHAACMVYTPTSLPVPGDDHPYFTKSSIWWTQVHTFRIKLWPSCYTHVQAQSACTNMGFYEAVSNSNPHKLVTFAFSR
ncbi:hypothetical protein ECG_09797 [Echinococcus granulosus]|nr:hypothetical protein ECG_09794 [Echinococcus granulosus]KAH9277813.1 hypothetical protein ECG_09797 [Echinococcus granulosus]